MGGRATAVRWGDTVFDGKIEHVMTVPLTAWAASAVSNLGGFVAPCDLDLVQVRWRVLTAATSAAALLNIGADAALDTIVKDVSFNGVGPGTGVIDLTNITLAPRPRAIAGEYIHINLEAATAVGNIALSALWVPRYA